MHIDTFYTALFLNWSSMNFVSSAALKECDFFSYSNFFFFSCRLQWLKACTHSLESFCQSWDQNKGKRSLRTLMSLRIPHTAGHISWQRQRYFQICFEAESKFTRVLRYPGYLIYLNKIITAFLQWFMYLSLAATWMTWLG